MAELYTPTKPTEPCTNEMGQDEDESPPYPDQQCSRTFPISSAYRVRRRGVGTKYMGSTSLSSPISILASPSSLVPGPLSAPATFSWGKQSPIPHRVTTPSPFLLSPGQEHYPPALASSPLIHTPDPLPRQFLQGEGKGPALSLGSEVPKPCIPVGIAVARQRTSETIHPTPPSSKQPGVQVEPWNIPNIPSLPVLPSHQLIHPLPLPDFFTNQPMQGAYLGGGGGGGGGFWNPYSSYAYPYLLPSSLSHYQHYQNQLLLLQQTAQSGLFLSGDSKPLIYPQYDPFRPLPPLSPKLEDKTEGEDRRQERKDTEKREGVEDEVKIISSHSFTRDDSGLGYSDISRTDIGVQDYSIRSRDYSSRFRDYTDRSRNFSGLQDYQERSRLDYSSQRDSVESAVDYRTTGVEYSNLPRDYSRKGREEDNISVGSVDHPDQPSHPILGIQPKQGLSIQSDPAKPTNQTNPESLKHVQSVIEPLAKLTKEQEILSGEPEPEPKSEPPEPELIITPEPGARAEPEPASLPYTNWNQCPGFIRPKSGQTKTKAELKQVPLITTNPDESLVKFENMEERRWSLNGLDLLTAGIDRLEERRVSQETTLVKSDPLVKQEPGENQEEKEETLNLAEQLINFASRPWTYSPGRVHRHASVDSIPQRKGQLGLLCDVASQQIQMDTLSPGHSRLNRSRSAEMNQERMNEVERKCRTVDPVSQQNIREFIRRRSSRSSEGPGSSPGKAGTSPYRAGSSPYRAGVSPCKSVDLDEMDAWEISMRLNMADIQKKYREKYRELFKLESRRERRKPKPKKTHTDAKNKNTRRKSSNSSQKSAINTENVRTSIEDDLSENSEIREPSSEPELIADNNNTEYDRCSEPGTLVYKSNFNETFAKFKQSYLSTKHGMEKSLAPKLVSPAVTSSAIKVKIDRPNPFQNLMKLSVNPIKSESEYPVIEPIYTVKSEPIDIKPDIDYFPEYRKPEVAKIFNVNKRKSLEEAPKDIYAKKRPKIEKFIVAKTETKAEKYYTTIYSAKKEENEKKMERKRSKDRCRKDHKNCKKHRNKETGRKYKSKDRELKQRHKEHSREKGTHERHWREESKHDKPSKHEKQSKHGKNKPAFNVEDNPAEEEERRKMYKEHKKDKKREKERKKKRKEKEKKLKRVKVRELVDDEYISQIMDRTPTPSQGIKEELQERSTTPCKKIKQEFMNRMTGPFLEIKQEIKEEVVEDWETPQDKMRSCVLSEDKLQDGQRILTRIGGHFHPGRITEISPPDIYGILVDRERGNKPHIYSREEALSQAILEVSPGRVENLEPGMRVCAYWSSKYNYLHPGTIVENTQGLDLPSDYLVIELDDGDSRDFHVDSIRYLPPGYPLVVGETDPMEGLSQIRRRRISSINLESPKKKKKSKKEDEKDEKAEKKERKLEKKELNPKEWRTEMTPSLKIKIRSPESHKQESSSEDGPPVLTPEVTRPLNPSGENLCPQLVKLELPGTSGTSRLRDEDEDSAFESNGRNEDDLEDDLESEDLKSIYRQRMPSADKSKIRAFLPPQHLLWEWGGEGTKPKNKTRKVFHDEIVRGEERIKVGESAVFLSTSRPDRPYIGQLESMWETWSGNMKVHVRWFYHAEETVGTGEGGRRVQDLNHPGALFESCHFDENDIQTISHKCDVVGFAEFLERLRETPSLKESIYENNDLYYLAGNYDPVVGTLAFKPGVFD